jgi:hypothetical protein
MKKDQIKAAWEALAGNEDSFGGHMETVDEPTASHFKSALPPAIKKPSDQRDNRERQRKHYQKHRQDILLQKKDKRRMAPPTEEDPPVKTSTFENLLGLGVRPRMAVAVNRMLAAKPDWMADEPVSMSKVASVMGNFRSTLCNDMAKVSGVKVAKGGAQGGGYSGLGGGGGGNCFLEGSQVKSPTGAVAIEELKPGSQVIGFDETTGVSKTLTVAKTASTSCFEWNRIHTASTVFDVTDTHPILTRTGWVEAGNIQWGDTLLTYGEKGPQAEEVTVISKVHDESRVHVIEIVEDPHNYIVSGVVAHNARISDSKNDDDFEAVKMADDMSEDDKKEASIRQDEWQLAQDTTKMGYAIAKALGANEAQAMAAGMYAFTQIPASQEVSGVVLEARYWNSPEVD